MAIRGKFGESFTGNPELFMRLLLQTLRCRFELGIHLTNEQLRTTYKRLDRAQILFDVPFHE